MGEIVDALKKAQQEVPKEPAHGQPTANAQVYARHPAPVEAHRITISRELDANRNAREVLLNPASAASEAYRKLALKVRAEMQRRGIRSLAITGPLREEGKTTTACNLALAMASLAGEQRIALVCLDLRRPNVARSFGGSAQVGLEQALRGETDILDCCHHTDVPSLDLYLSSRPCEDSHSLLATTGFSSCLRTLEARYSVIIIDTPPVLLVPDTVMITEETGGWLAVVRRGKTRMKNLSSACDVLPKDRCLGIVLNECQISRNAGQYGYYYLDEQREED